jgi:hypothetical protein
VTLYLLLTVLCLLLGVTCLESDLRLTLCTRRGQWPLAALEQLTGLPRRALRERLGLRPEDREARLVEVPAAVLADLPRSARRDPYHPLANALAVGILAWGLASAWSSGAPAFRSLAFGGGYLAVCLVVNAIALAREARDEDEPDADALDLDAFDEAFARLDRAGTTLRAKSLQVVAMIDQLEASARAHYDRVWPGPADPTFARVVAWIYGVWLARQVRRVRHEAERLVAEVEERRRRWNRDDDEPLG